MTRISLPACMIFLLAVSSCGKAVLSEDAAETLIRFRIDDGLSVSRSADPPDQEGASVSDINLFIFNSHGLLEYRQYLSGGEFRPKLLLNSPYSVYACANTGYELEIKSLEELRAFRYHFSYPDDYRGGIPMSGAVSGAVPGENTEIIVPLSRIMAKVSVSIDRSGLDSGVQVEVRSIKVGNCPRNALLFGSGGAESENDMFPSGFIKSGTQTDSLNTDRHGRRSGEVSLYLPENMQDRMDESLCSYIEIRADYFSSKYFSGPERYLTYRFYIGENDGSYSVERNRHYHITVCLNGEALDGDSWRVDTGRLGSLLAYGQTLLYQ